jgi:hypothetical protein
MPDISNHELDKLFQEAAAGIKPKFDPEDWERLAKRLDQEDNTSFARTISLYSIAVLLGLISIFPGQETSMAATAEQVRKESYEGARSEESSVADAMADKSGARSEKSFSGDFRRGVRSRQSDVAILSGQTPLEEPVQKDSQGEISPEGGGVSGITAGKQEATKTSGGGDVPSGVLPSGSVNNLAPVQHSADSRGMLEEKVERKDRPVEVSSEGSSVAKTSSHKVSTGKPMGKHEGASASVNSEVSSSDSGSVLAPAEHPIDAKITLEKKGDKRGKGINETRSEALSFDRAPADKTAGKSAGDSVTSKVSSSGELKKSGSIKSESRPAASGSSQTDSVKASPSAHRVSGAAVIPMKVDERTSKGEVRSNEQETANRKFIQPDSFGETRGQQSDSADSILVASLHRNKQRAVVTDHSTSSQNDTIGVLKPVQRISDSTQVVAVAEEVEKKKEESAGSQWFLKLPVSPDFTSINYYKPGKTGLNIGLLVEYIPGKHLAFSTGAIWSRKLYSTDDPGTSYSSGPYTSKVSFLDGDCRVLDIPVNVTYYLPLRTRMTFFATAGLSSYIMLKEKYTYTVTANNRDYYYSEDFTRKNNEWFSMLNLSIGIQRQIGQRFWLQAEPFLKAPLSGIGEGKVDLVSMGAFFTLKYQLKK